MRILSLIFLAFALLAPMQANSAQRKPDIPDGEIGKNLPWFSNTGSANDENYGNPDRTPKPLPKPGGLVGGIAGSIIIDTLVDVVDKGLDKVLDPNSHTSERFPVNGCGNYGDVRTGKGVGLADYAGGVCQHHYQDSRFELKSKVFMQSGKGVTYYLQCTKHPFSFSVSCYAYDEVQDDKKDPKTDNKNDYWQPPTAPNATPTPDNSVKPSPSNDPNNNPTGNPNNDPNKGPQPSPNPQNDPNSNPNSDDDPANNPSNNPNNDPKKDPKANPNSKDDPNNESDKDKQKDEQDKPNQNQKDEPKPFVLPKFCDWAKFICDDTIKDDKDTKIDIGDNDFDFTPIAEKSYVTLPKQCPANPKIGFTMPFVNERLELEFPLDIFCHFFALFKPVIIMYAYIKALVIIGKD